MLDLQRDVLLSAVSALPAPLFQQVLPHFVAEQSTLLVIDPGYFRPGQLLGVKAYRFNRNRTHRRKLQATPGPCFDMLHPALKLGWQPVCRPGAVVEPGLAVAGFSETPASSNSSSFFQVVFDLVASMLNFKAENTLPAPLSFDHQGVTCSLGAGIDPKLSLLDLTVIAIMEDNGKRLLPEYRCPTGAEHLSGPGRTTGH